MGGRFMGSRFNRCLAVVSLLAMVLPCAAVTPGMVDTFQAGADRGWGYGPAGSAIEGVTSGGPAGPGDGYLKVDALGGVGANSRFTVIAGPQWSGDYLAAGVNGIEMDVRNLAGTALSLRLWLAGPLGATALSADPVLLPAFSGWTHVSFALGNSALVGQVAATLADVQQLRLFHATNAAFPGPPIVASLGVDNVSAVPEPAVAWLMLPGLLAVGALLRRRRAA